MYELYANNTGGEKYTDNEKKSKRDGQSGDDTASKVAYHRQMAQAYRDSILDLCWDSEKVRFLGIFFGTGKALTRRSTCSHGSTTST